MRVIKKKPDTQVHDSSGNVFADLGLAPADQLLGKARLLHQIRAVIAREKLDQREAGRKLGIDQPKISALMRGRFAGFSTDRLLKFLVLLDQDVRITIKQAPRKRTARVVVEAA